MTSHSALWEKRLFQLTPHKYSEDVYFSRTRLPSLWVTNLTSSVDFFKKKIDSLISTYEDAKGLEKSDVLNWSLYAIHRVGWCNQRPPPRAHTHTTTTEWSCLISQVKDCHRFRMDNPPHPVSPLCSLGRPVAAAVQRPQSEWVWIPSHHTLRACTAAISRDWSNRWICWTETSDFSRTRSPHV